MEWLLLRDNETAAIICVAYAQEIYELFLFSVR
jgi:hypothetical protein